MGVGGPHHTPHDIVLLHKKEKTCLLINIAIPDYSNFSTKETEKLRKYKDLEIKLSRMWKVRTKTVPVITGALGTIREGLDQKLHFLPHHLSAIEATEDHTNKHRTHNL